MELPLFTALILTAATITDMKWRKIPDVLPVMIGAAAFTIYYTMSPAYLAAALIMGLVFAVTAYLLERRQVWKRGDTYLFTATGMAAWPIILEYLTIFLTVAVMWTAAYTAISDDEKEGLPFAPVFFLTWTVAVYLI